MKLQVGKIYNTKHQSDGKELIVKVDKIVETNIFVTIQNDWGIHKKGFQYDFFENDNMNWKLIPDRKSHLPTWL